MRLKCDCHFFFPALSYLYNTIALWGPIDTAANQAKYLKTSILWRIKVWLYWLWLLFSFNNTSRMNVNSKTYEYPPAYLSAELNITVCKFLSSSLAPNYPTEKLVSKHFITRHLSFLRARVSSFCLSFRDIPPHKQSFVVVESQVR